MENKRSRWKRAVVSSSRMNVRPSPPGGQSRHSPPTRRRLFFSQRSLPASVFTQTLALPHHERQLYSQSSLRAVLNPLTRSLPLFVSGNPSAAAGRNHVMRFFMDCSYSLAKKFIQLRSCQLGFRRDSWLVSIFRNLSVSWGEGWESR